MESKKHVFFMGLISVFVLILSNKIAGQIPVNNGAGWDGYEYLNLLIQWRESGHVPSDPYRMSRVFGFLPLLASEFIWTLDIDRLIILQTKINIFGMGIAICFFMDYLLKCGATLKSAYKYSIALLLTWPVLVMPTYYPILSDHLAIILSCICLWCHIESRYKTLAAICVISPVVMPGYFLVPFILLCITPKLQSSASFINISVSARWRLVIFFTLVLLMVCFVLSWMLTIDSEALLHKGLFLIPSLVEWRHVSTAYVVIFMIFVAWLWTTQLHDGYILSRVSLKLFILGLISIVIGHLMLYLSLDWDKGFKGPPFLENIFSQALNAPFKPLVAHFVLFGPAFVGAFLFLFKKEKISAISYPVKCCLLAFLPLFVICSESRQWVSTLPLFFAFLAQNCFCEKRINLIIIFSVLLSAPLFWLSNYVNKAMKLGLWLDSPEWQIYFGRQGPWMSQTMYAYSFIMMLLFVFLWFLINSEKSK